MVGSQLSRKNREFIFHLTKLLKNSKSINNEKAGPIINKAKKDLLANQKKGVTSRQIFGTPKEYYQDLIDPKGAAKRKKRLNSIRHSNSNTSRQNNVRKPKFSEQLYDFSFGTEFIDTSWTLLIMFSALYAITEFLPSKNSQANIGLLTLLFFSLISGAAYVYILRIFTPNPEKKKRIGIFQRIIYTIFAIVGWFLIFSIVSQFIPKDFNLPLNSYWLLLIVIISWGGYYFWKKRSPLPKGLLVISGLAANSTAEYRRKYPKKRR